jgi:hypothetical protein
MLGTLGFVSRLFGSSGVDFDVWITTFTCQQGIAPFGCTVLYMVGAVGVGVSLTLWTVHPWSVLSRFDVASRKLAHCAVNIVLAVLALLRQLML